MSAMRGALSHITLSATQNNDDYSASASASASHGAKGDDEFASEVEAMLRARDDTVRNKRSDIPPLGARIPIERLPVSDNPLEKDGRNTVICGRLPDDNPFARAARILGLRLVSLRYAHHSIDTIVNTSKQQQQLQQQTQQQTKQQEQQQQQQQEQRTPRERLRLFLLDCNDVYRQLKGHCIKVPIIGGGPLNMFQLMEEVFLLGGLQNVVEKRAFRIVAQQLELPATCTSAAYVLKGAYERFLYHYEQLLVFGRWPQNAGETINMKHVVSETRERERRALRTSLRSHTRRLARRHFDHDDHDHDDHDHDDHNDHDDGDNGDDEDDDEEDEDDDEEDEEDDDDEANDNHIDAVNSADSHENTCKRRRVRMRDTTEASPPPLGVSKDTALALKEFVATSSTDATATWNFYCHLTGEEGGEFNLPRWALELPSAEAYESLIWAARNVEKRGQGKLFACTAKKVDEPDRQTSTLTSKFVFDDFLRTGIIHVCSSADTPDPVRRRCLNNKNH